MKKLRLKIDLRTEPTEIKSELFNFKFYDLYFVHYFSVSIKTG